MSNYTPTREGLKEKAKVIRKFMNEKCNADISHSQCLELISQLFDFKDWNTASAISRSKENLPTFVKTAGDMKMVLEAFDDSAKLETWNTLVIGGLLEALKTLDINDGSFQSKYSLIFDGEVGNRASFQLKLENERLFSADGDEIVVGIEGNVD